MAQEIIVYLILAGSVAYIIYLTFKKYLTKKSNPCDTCEGCPLKDKHDPRC
jgi:hypothetical protein